MSPETMPHGGIHLALRVWCSPREARIRAARVRYGQRWQDTDGWLGRVSLRRVRQRRRVRCERRWQGAARRADAKKRAFGRWKLACRIIAERLP